MKNNNLELIGEWDGWKVYKNSDGFLEGFKKIGKNKYSKIDLDQGADVKRVVTNQKTINGFEQYVRGLKNDTPTKEKRIRASELPSLFNEL